MVASHSESPEATQESPEWSLWAPVEPEKQLGAPCGHPGGARAPTIGDFRSLRTKSAAKRDPPGRAHPPRVNSKAGEDVY